MSPIFQNWINSKFGALIQNGTSDKPVFNNSNRVARILYRLSAYRRLSWHMVWRGVPAREIIRSQFPYIERSPCRPLFITIEFTNYCDLRCVDLPAHSAFGPEALCRRRYLTDLLKVLNSSA